MLAKRKMTLTELCDKLDMTLASLSHLKTGKARGIRFNTLEGICEALECEPSDILQYMDEKTFEKEYGKWMGYP